MSEIAEDLRALYEWIRQPDWQEKFGSKELARWLNERPLATPLAAKAEIEKVCAQRDALAAENARLREALEDCHRQFNFYAEEHEKAGKTAKAATNRGFAGRIEELLATSQVASGTGAKSRPPCPVCGYEHVMGIPCPGPNAAPPAPSAGVSEAEHQAAYDAAAKQIEDGDGYITAETIRAALEAAARAREGAQ